MKKLVYESLGGFGNTLFGIFRALKDSDQVILRSFLEITDDMRSLLNFIFNDRVICTSERVFSQSWLSNPHFSENRKYKDGEVVEGFNQVMPSLELILHYRSLINPSIIPTDYVAIHVRRGDFLLPQNSKKHATMDINYYRKAMSMFPKDTKFIIVTDDRKWCEENFTNVDYSGGDLIGDFKTLLSASKGVIYGNSSFGYFGALLNPNKDKLVVACKNWYKLGFNDWNKSYGVLYPENYPDKLKLINYLFV